MTIDLNKQEIDLLNDALVYWVQQPRESALLGTMFASVLAKGPREEHIAKTDAALKAADEEAKKREIKSVMLRAKLFQSLAGQGEHEISA